MVVSDQSSVQLTFALPHRPSLSGDDFFVSESNRDAVEAVDRWPDWPAHALALVGPASSGKTHLASVWREKSGATLLLAADVSDQLIETLDGAGCYVLEDAGQVRDETAFFHLLNWVREGGGSLLITSSEPLSRLPVGLKDLHSRLAALPVAKLQQADDMLLGVLIGKQFADRQISVDDAVIQYVLARIERTSGALADVVEALDQASLVAGRRITIPLARDVLKALGG